MNLRQAEFVDQIIGREESVLVENAAFDVDLRTTFDFFAVFEENHRGQLFREGRRVDLEFRRFGRITIDVEFHEAESLQVAETRGEIDEDAGEVLTRRRPRRVETHQPGQTRIRTDLVVEIVRSIMKNVRLARRFRRREEQKMKKTPNSEENQRDVGLFAIEQQTIGHLRVFTDIIDVMQPGQRLSSSNRDDRGQKQQDLRVLTGDSVVREDERRDRRRNDLFEQNVEDSQEDVHGIMGMKKNTSRVPRRRHLKKNKKSWTKK